MGGITARAYGSEEKYLCETDNSDSVEDGSAEENAFVFQ